MAGSGKETGFGPGRSLQLGICFAELLRSFRDLLLQCLLGPSVRRHITITGHIAATGGGIADDAHDASIVLLALHPVFAPGAHMLEAAGNLVVDLLLRCATLFQIEADEIGNRSANACQIIG